MIEILNENLKKIDILRKYTFAQYEDKFREIGKFEIHARIVDENLYLLDKNKEYYVLFDGNVFGKVENVKKESDSEYEKTIVLKGRLAKLLFSKRVIAGTIKYKGNTANFVESVIQSEITKDSSSKRYVNIDVQYDDKEYLDSFCSKIEKQVTGGYVWEEIQKVLEQDKLGIYFTPVLRTEHMQEGEQELTNISKWNLVISAGKDRTKGNKQGNVPVVFSQSLSNIARTDYEIDTSKYCNVAYVAGEGQEEQRKWYEVYAKEEQEKGATDKRGWKRNELWIDARDIQSSGDDGNSITEEEYVALIKQRANEKFTENAKEEAYTSTITEANKQYVYGEDYTLGDLVTVIDDELGISIDVQITSVTRSIEGVREIIDIGFDYGKINRDPVKQIGSMAGKIEKNENDIKYIEGILEQSNLFYKKGEEVTLKLNSAGYVTTSGTNFVMSFSISKLLHKDIVGVKIKSMKCTVRQNGRYLLGTAQGPLEVKDSISTPERIVFECLKKGSVVKIGTKMEQAPVGTNNNDSFGCEGEIVLQFI